MFFPQQLLLKPVFTVSGEAEQVNKHFMLWINKLYLQIWRLMINCSSPAATNDPSHDSEEPTDWLFSLSSPLPRFDLTRSHIMCRRRVVVVLMVTTVTAACAKAAVRGVAVILACLRVRRVQ